MLAKVRFVDSAIQLMKPAPAGRPKNWAAYRARFVEPVRIDAGVAFWNDYSDALERAEAQYGVPAEIIVGILGVETVYGRNKGNFRVMDAVTTLAFAYPDTPNRQRAWNTSVASWRTPCCLRGTAASTHFRCAARMPAR